MNDPLDDLLDARLRDETPYIDDAGFTRRVMKQLPRHRVSWSSQRSFIILAATILSVVVAYFASGEGMFVLVACGITMTVAGLWVALARRHETIV